jgi:hypothetical protein
MSFSIVPLLLHSDAVPSGARSELRAAYDAPLEERSLHLEAAARILYLEADLDCGDARELVGLSDAGSCRHQRT